MCVCVCVCVCVRVRVRVRVCVRMSVLSGISGVDQSNIRTFSCRSCFQRSSLM